MNLFSFSPAEKGEIVRVGYFANQVIDLYTGW